MIGRKTKLNSFCVNLFTAPVLLAVFLLLLTYLFAPKSSAEIGIDAESLDSIAHFRATPMYLDDESQRGFVRHSAQDKDGYLWLSTDGGIERYDGYSLVHFTLEYATESAKAVNSLLFTDSQRNIWVGGADLHRFNYETQAFEPMGLRQFRRINGIIEDNQGRFWISGIGTTLIHYDPNTNTVLSEHRRLPGQDFISSIAYEPNNERIWLAGPNGIFVFDTKDGSYTSVSTKLNQLFNTMFIRDIVIDSVHNELWLGTPKGLIQLNTLSFDYTIHSVENFSKGLLTSDVSTVFQDSANNIWLGLEKRGVCIFKRSTERFLCSESSLNEENKLPFSTVEDITEDANGSLWLSVNFFGMYRMTPSLEIFKRLKDEITQPPQSYFPHSFDSVQRQNGDIWIATDGGGINIFNPNTGAFSNIKSDPLNPNTLSTDAVISIAQDNKGFIWTGHWAGGLSRIDPKTLSVERFEHDPSLPLDKTLRGNNIFMVLPDDQDGLWVSVWGFGLQYFNYETRSFNNYLHEQYGDDSGILNTEITHMQFLDDKIFISGQAGSEYFDLSTKRFTTIEPANNYAHYFVLAESMEEIYIATIDGLIILNGETGERRKITVEDGLADNFVNYLTKDEYGRLWIATQNGLSILSEDGTQITSYFEKDGLVSDTTSTHGEFFQIGKTMYIPNKDGVNIVNIDDIRPASFKGKTVISGISMNNRDFTRSIAVSHDDIHNPKEVPEFAYSFNGLSIDFSSLNFVFPENNIFKYRLKGWQEEFLTTSASDRSVRFNNLPAGEYEFEVFASGGNGLWDEEGASFRFIVLSPWWETWWARLLFVLVLLSIIFGFSKWRLSLVKHREQELALKVEEKTLQLKQYAKELESASDSLAQLNSELEERVEKRTAELQVEVSERKVAESKLFHLAFHDSLTGLPNREWLIKKINSLLAKNKSQAPSDFGLMFLDGDRFKQINDTHGHMVGDELLIASGMRLSKLLSENAHAARLGGDEFTVIAENVVSADELEALAASIIEAFKLPFTIDKITIHFNVSIGVVLCDSSYSVVTGVLRDADIAMYHAKQAERGTYKIFDQAMRNQTMELSQLESDLHDAVENQEFSLVYQPLLDLKSGEINSFEALIRWQHPHRGNIPPDMFIPMAEETGLIVDIGEWVLKTACEQLKMWQLFDLIGDVGVAVNLSSNQLKGDSFLATIDRILQETGLEGKYLKFELTESTLVENSDSMKDMLESIITKDIELAIDDFGTGYSSLAYLNQLPVQHIKVDRRFVDAIDNTPDGKINEDALEVVKATVSLGHSLRMKITAEGIESETQLQELRKMGADYAQGYYISKPLPQDKVVAFLNKPLSFDSNQTQSNPLKKYKESLAVKQKRLKKD